MDAVDLVLTVFDGSKMTDICSYSEPFSQNMQRDMAFLRTAAYQKNKQELLSLSGFDAIHDAYIRQIANCINNMLKKNNIDRQSIDAVGFHGKTLDHNPPSQSPHPYTLQIGSGQMLADLTGIKVVYDFRSDFIMRGFEGAPLIPLHNAHIASQEGDGWYINGGNTSNFALIHNSQAVFASDIGPFNEYTDAYIRQQTSFSFDKDGQIGLQGKLLPDLLKKLFDFGKNFYNMPFPRSGDPAYYDREAIFASVRKEALALPDVIHTFEYFAAYLVGLALTLVPKNVPFPNKFILFGGGWKNPVVRETFENLLRGNGFILPEHRAGFSTLITRLKSPVIKMSIFGDFMEARLMADMARYRLENKPWELPGCPPIVSGIIAQPNAKQTPYTDKINRAAKGWSDLT